MINPKGLGIVYYINLRKKINLFSNLAPLPPRSLMVNPLISKTLIGLICMDV